MLRPCTFIPVLLSILVGVALRAIPIAAGGSAQTPTATAAEPIRVTVWTWMIRVENINSPADELPVDMYVTFTYDLRYKDKINPMKHFEIIEAKSLEKREEDEEARPEEGKY